MNGRIILPNEFLSLAEENLKDGKSVKILADGPSMFPFIHGARDLVEIIPVRPDENPMLWEVYFFIHNGKYKIHRFVGREDDFFIMRGDGNLKISEKVKQKDIIGKLYRIHKPDGTVIDCTSKKWLRKGCTWNKLLPLRRYMLAAVRRLYRFGIIR